ncbi:MAG: hypothetical protein KGM24_01530, partial [Elusimicrobia bacterium]|nr:hypothetical protein [Elusimicrobiota bacterium]
GAVVEAVDRPAAPPSAARPPEAPSASTFWKQQIGLLDKTVYIPLRPAPLAPSSSRGAASSFSQAFEAAGGQAALVLHRAVQPTVPGGPGLISQISGMLTRTVIGIPAVAAAMPKPKLPPVQSAVGAIDAPSASALDVQPTVNVVGKQTSLGAQTSLSFANRVGLNFGASGTVKGSPDTELSASLQAKGVSLNGSASLLKGMKSYSLGVDIAPAPHVMLKAGGNYQRSAYAQNSEGIYAGLGVDNGQQVYAGVTASLNYNPAARNPDDARVMVQVSGNNPAVVDTVLGAMFAPLAILGR